MPLLPYCVFLPGPVDLPKHGVSNDAVQLLEAAGLAAIYSELDPQTVAGDRFQRAALDFHDVVHGVFAERAVIPFRFPIWLSADELRDHLVKESAKYVDFLRNHAHDVQMEVRLWPFDVAQKQAGSGIEHMTRLMEREMRLRSAAETLQHAVTEGVREWRVHPSRDLTRLFALVQRNAIARFRQAMSDAIRPGNTRFRISGPWPAMEFMRPTNESNAARNVVSIGRGETS
jgi:hypothetical protein